MGKQRNRDLPKGVKKRIDDLLGHLEDIRRAAPKIGRSQLEELYYRALIPTVPSAFPSSSISEYSTGGGSDNSPTESAYAARGDHRSDALLRDVRKIGRDIEEAEAALTRAVNSLAYLMSIPADERGRQESNPCAICLVLPAQKAGYCDGHHSDWRKHGSPDRLAWERFRRQEVHPKNTIRTRKDGSIEDLSGTLMVPDCPKPTPGYSCTRGPWKAAAEA